MTNSQPHPSVEDLTAFSTGRLPSEDAASVESHIGECTPCCETLMGLSTEDTFVGLLKETRDPVHAATIGVSKCATHDNQVQPRTVLANHPRYEIEGLIAKGGMGEVFKAKHRMMDRRVALKVISQELTRNPEAVERFHREVKTAAHLAHRNIVTAYDAEQAEGIHFLVMEYVDGVDLAERVLKGDQLSVGTACDYVHQAATGLQHAHQEGMVHRDIKPHNLMLTNDGTVKILDFGLASLSSSNLISTGGDLPENASLTAAGSIMGTPDFISPEQAASARDADIRSDVYSLGATLYYLLSGQPPFAEGSVAERLKHHAESEPVAIKSLRYDVPQELADVLSRMMAKAPEQRFQTPQEVADALAPFVGQCRSKPASVLTPSTDGGRSKWTPTRLIAIAFGAFAFFLASVIYVQTDKGTLRIESDDDSVEVVISKAETASGDSYIGMNVVDTVTGTEVKRLPSGEYTVSLGKTGSEFQLSKGGFTLSRGDDVIVKVTRRLTEKLATEKTVVPPLTLPKMAQHAYSMQGGRLSAKEAQALQKKADGDPADFGSRLQLLAYYSRKSLSMPETLEPHKKLVLWLVRNYPESDAAGSFDAHFHTHINPDGYVKAKALWLEHAKTQSSNVVILRNAANYFLLSDRATAEDLLKKAQVVAPNDADLAHQLGHLYHLEVSRLEGDARRKQASLVMKQYEIAVANVGRANHYWYADLAKAAINAAAFDKAEQYAKELLELSGEGKAVHDGNMVLGLVALNAGDIDKAKTHLLASAKVVDGPTITTSGPNMSLAKALLEKDEKEMVLEFFQLVSKFWKSEKLSTWIAEVKRDEIPKFGANLAY